MGMSGDYQGEGGSHGDGEEWGLEGDEEEGLS